MEMEIWVLLVTLGLMVLLFATGITVAFCVSIAGIVGVFILFNGDLSIIGTMLWTKINSFVIAVVIFFILMGELLGESRLSNELYDSAYRWLSRFSGGTLHTNVVAATIFAACTGISAAAAGAMGKMAYEAGNKAGYSIKLSMGSMAAGASLGILIPPSVVMIIYGVICEVSIGRLFIAGIIPGLCLSGLFMAYIAFHAWRHPEEAPRGRSYSWREKITGLRLALPILAMVVVVLGSIYGGFATPNEAGAVGALFALILGLAYRRLTWTGLGTATEKTARAVAMIGSILLGISALMVVITHAGVGHMAIKWIQAMGISWEMLFPFLAVVYVILGCFFDSYSILLVTLPFIWPMVEALGVDGVLFGVLMTLLIETGLITPPFGINLFVLDGIVGGGHLDEIVRGIIPFFIILCVFIFVIFFFPQIALWLPSTMYAR